MDLAFNLWTLKKPHVFNVIRKFSVTQKNASKSLTPMGGCALADRGDCAIPTTRTGGKSASAVADIEPSGVL
jgi:hypothetical protein